MDDRQLLRYSRHILLDEFGIEAQQRLLNASVLVVGAGGLGAGALPYLAAAGIGRIVIADGDRVDLTNLQRQVVHRESSIGANKAASAQQRLREINSDIVVEAVQARLTEKRLDELVASVSLVLDCCDNFATRHAINAVCVRHKRMLVSGAAIRFDGQLVCFDLANPISGCYACLFPAPNRETPSLADADSSVEDGGEERCAVMGVYAPLVGVIGAMQAAEAIRMLSGVGEASLGRLRLFSALDMRWREMHFKRDAECAVCRGNTLREGAANERGISYA
jgi:molybdopterin-synthase adenylyltransferase